MRNKPPVALMEPALKIVSQSKLIRRSSPHHLARLTLMEKRGLKQEASRGGVGLEGMLRMDVISSLSTVNPRKGC